MSTTDERITGAGCACGPDCACGCQEGGPCSCIDGCDGDDCC